jgi:hypothetical protein
MQFSRERRLGRKLERGRALVVAFCAGAEPAGIGIR